MQSLKRKITNKIVNYSISSINMKCVIYFIENIKNISIITNDNILPFHIIGYSNSTLTLQFISKNREEKQQMLDNLIISSIIGISIEELLNLLTKDYKPKGIFEEEETLIQDNIIQQKWQNDMILKFLLIDNHYYYVSYHPLELSIIETINITVEEYINKNNKSIRFWNYRIGDIGLEYLSMKFILMSNLIKLNLNASGINNLGLSYLSNSLKYIAHLQELWFHCNNITYNGIKSLSENLHYINNLNKLGMNRNYISDNGLIYLCKYLRDIPNLIHLDIGYNCIKEDGIKELCNSLNYISKLKKLNLRENRIYDLCNNILMEKLKLCPELEYLDIEGENMPNEEIYERIKKNHTNNLLNIVKLKVN